MHSATESAHVVGTAVKEGMPFKDWMPKNVIELMTECLGARGCDLSVSMVDETLLLKGGSGNGKLIVQRVTATGSEPEWLHQSARIWIGAVQLNNAMGNVYNRHRRSDAIHYQLHGTRTLVTQRGIIELEPGDFISVPRVYYYTSICAGKSRHVLVLTSVGLIQILCIIISRIFVHRNRGLEASKTFRNCELLYPSPC